MDFKLWLESQQYGPKVNKFKNLTVKSFGPKGQIYSYRLTSPKGIQADISIMSEEDYVSDHGSEPIRKGPRRRREPVYVLVLEDIKYKSGQDIHDFMVKLGLFAKKLKFKELKLSGSLGLRFDQDMEEFLRTNLAIQSRHGYAAETRGTKTTPLPIERLGRINKYVPQYVIAYHGTTRPNIDPSKVDEFGASGFHVGTYQAAQERIGLRPGLPLGLLSPGGDKPKILTVIVDASKIYGIKQPVDEVEANIEKKPGYYGMAYVNRGEDMGSISFVIWDKRAIISIK